MTRTLLALSVLAARRSAVARAHRRVLRLHTLPVGVMSYPASSPVNVAAHIGDIRIDLQ